MAKVLSSHSALPSFPPSSFWAGSSVGSWPQLTTTEIIVRNPFEAARIPLRKVTEVSPGYKGLVITLANRTGTTAWAVQKPDLSSWLHMHTRADDIAETILAAACEAGT